MKFINLCIGGTILLATSAFAEENISTYVVVDNSKICQENKNLEMNPDCFTGEVTFKENDGIVHVSGNIDKYRACNLALDEKKNCSFEGSATLCKTEDNDIIIFTPTEEDPNIDTIFVALNAKGLMPSCIESINNDLVLKQKK